MAKRSEPQAYPVFRHQLEAMLARIARADREAIGGSLKSLRIKAIEPSKERTPAGAIVRWSASKGLGDSKGRTTGRLIDFRYASPISKTPRQGGDIRFPHFSVVRVNKVVVPKSRDGRTHPDYPERNGIGVAHHKYVTQGGLARERDHLDYIKRAGALDSPPDDPLPSLDLLDARDDWRLQNSLAIYSNIPGGPERERSLFEAAERRASVAKTGTLTVSSRHADAWLKVATRPGAPRWVRDAAGKLAAARRRAELSKGRTPKVRDVKISDADLAEIFDRLAWCDGSGLPNEALPEFKPGRCGRIQTRFVGELPRGLGPRERHEIFTRFCDHLSDQGWMVVGAIHRPDPHNDLRNFHFHIDGYDRPARWLDEQGCWDFDFEVKHRNGKPSFPFRQNKIAEVSQTTGKGVHFAKQAAAWMAKERQTYVDIVNDLVAGRPGIPRYVAGTYKSEGIELTPLKHLGSKVIAAEKEGLVTETGSENARAIFGDELRAIVRIMEAQLRKLERVAGERIKRARAIAARGAVDTQRNLIERRIVRRAQNAALPVLERMASSRALTILEHQGGNSLPGLIDHARAWLREIDAISPMEKRVRVEGRVLNRLERAAAAAGRRADLLDDAPAGLTYEPRSTATLKPVLARYEHASRQRLAAWLDKHLGDPTRVEFAVATFKLGPSVRQTAIDRLLRLFGHEPEIQSRLAAEMARRLQPAGTTHVTKPRSGALAAQAEGLAGTGRPTAGEIPKTIAKGPAQPDQELRLFPGRGGQQR